MMAKITWFDSDVIGDNLMIYRFMWNHLTKCRISQRVSLSLSSFQHHIWLQWWRSWINYMSCNVSKALKKILHFLWLSASADACNELIAYSLVFSCCCYTCCFRRKLRNTLNIKVTYVPTSKLKFSFFISTVFKVHSTHHPPLHERIGLN